MSSFWPQLVEGARPVPRRRELLQEGAPSPHARVPTVGGGPPLLPATGRLVERLRRDERVLGVILGGSVATGGADAESDDDLEIVVEQALFDALGRGGRRRVLVGGAAGRRQALWDAALTSLADLDARCASPRDAEHWPYEHGRVLWARDGRVAERVAALAALPPAFRGARIRHALLDLLLAGDRGRACERRGQRAEQTVIAVRGATALARILFALERRWVPLDHWLSRELATLADPADNARCVLAALQTGRVAPLLEGRPRLSAELARRGLPTPDDRDELAAVLLSPRRRRERLVHGLC